MLVTGFGVLLALWTLGARPDGRPGLFPFKSATWGDGLALPLMTGFLVYATRALPPARGDRRFAVAAAVFGGALGLLSQVLWLADPDPRPNWTLPRPHRFTAAGWYHAVFVVAVCALTAALLGLVLNRLTLAVRRPRRASAALTAGIACGLGFVALLVLDADAAPGIAGVGGVGIAVVATAVVFAVVFARRRGSGVGSVARRRG